MLNSTKVLLTLCFALACQSQNAKSRKPVDSANGMPRGMGPIVETAMMPSGDKTPAEVPNENAPNGPGDLSPGAEMSQPPEASADETPIEKEVGPVEPDANPNLPFGPPKMFRKGAAVMISRPEYAISWNRQTRNADWTAWRLTPADLGDQKRSEAWSLDPDLEAYLSEFGEKAVRTTDYQGSCYDRGHMTPSADRTMDFDANAATFLMSNMIPQTAFLNRVIWERLEREERTLAEQEGCVWIVAGPIYGKRMGRIGKDATIAVPEATWKVITSCEKPVKVLASVIMPNVNGNNIDPVDDNSQCSLMKGSLPQEWTHYKTPLSEIEQRGLIRFPLGL